jgi:IclR family acetate operon transcriptional repressor
VERAFEVLQCVKAAPEPLGVSDIARRLGLNVSTVYRLVRALEQAGFVEQDADTRRYRLGMAIAGLNRVLYHQRRFDEARPELRRLREATGGHAVLALRDGDRAIVVSELPGDGGGDDVRGGERVANAVPLHASAFGKVLLAFAAPPGDDPAALEPLERFTEHTITALPRLREELTLVRRRGWALSSRELYPRQLTVAAPVLDRDGRGYLALGVGTVWSRANAARVRSLAAEVLASAERLRPLLVPGAPARPFRASRPT